MGVVSFAAEREARQPHWTGTVKCVGCGAEHEATAPMGTEWVECASCHFPKATPKYPFGAQNGDLVFRCNPCGGEALTAYQREGRMYVRCMGCGTDHTEAFYE